VTLVRTCPRCGAAVRAPGLWADSWTCSTHGAIVPVHPTIAPTPDAIRRLARDSQVPLWLPWPLPEGWLISGLRWAGDDRGGPVATVLAVSGPTPLPEAEEQLAADLLLVAEQPGVGLGPRLAGQDEYDPGDLLNEQVAKEPAHFKIDADGHETPMWSVPEDDGVGFVGEASGVWLWLLAWPSSAAAVLLHRFGLVDLRTSANSFDLPCGAVTPRLG
jgi:hypothetical protein